MITPYLKYLSYVLRHKWHVLVECWKAGLIWQGIIHDWSKFLPDEFIPYANYFYGSDDQKRDETGYYKPGDTGDADFDLAWLRHIHRHTHHWQWWVLLQDDGGKRMLPMSDKARREMLADWRGAGKAQGYGDNTLEWYQKNKDKMQLNPETRTWIELKLGLVTDTRKD